MTSLKIIKPGMHVLVVGLGKSGISAVKFLKKLGVKISVSEGGRATEPDQGIIRWLQGEGDYLEIGGHSSELFTSVDCILVSPGVPLNLPVLDEARLKDIPVVGEMALLADYLKTPLIAVTGTNGKSTVTTLIGDLLRASGKKVFVGGNIGIPLTDYLIGPQDADVVVAEVSSFQLDTAGEFKPNVALLLNLSPDHLDRYDSYDAYVHSKFSIFANQGREDVAIVNADDPEIMNCLNTFGIFKRETGKSNGVTDDLKSRVFTFGKQLKGAATAYSQGKKIILSGLGEVASPDEQYDLATSALSESPNLENAMAAILAVRSMGCPIEAVEKGIATFTPLPHRLELIAEIDGVRYYDDSKATNIGAVQSALAGMERPVVLIAGGRDKDGDFSLLKELAGQKIKTMLLIGEAKEKMAHIFADVTSTEFCDSLPAAVSKAHDIAMPGDAVLLSPGCASFDMFRGFAHRGEVFKEAVLNLKGDRGLEKGNLVCPVQKASAA